MLDQPPSDPDRTNNRNGSRAIRWLAAGAGMAATAYAVHAGLTWQRYGRPRRRLGPSDAELDRFMPEYEVVERHYAHINAPSEIVWATARDLDLLRSPLVRAIFRTREILLGSDSRDDARPSGLLAQMKTIGWGILAEVPGQELVFGGVTRPWEAHPVFVAPPTELFSQFREPNLVKIVWNLRARPIGVAESIFSTETRAIATDPASRASFRNYWAFVLPGVILIRKVLIRMLRKEAERRYRRGTTLEGAACRAF